MMKSITFKQIRRGRIRYYLERLLIAAITIGLSIIFIFPFLWTVSSSLKQPLEVQAYPPSIFPKVPQWQNYKEAWTMISFGRFFLNTFFVALTALFGQVISATIVAYGFARFRFRGREALFTLVLSTMILPIQVTIIPLFILYAKIHWINSFKPLIVPSYFGGGAFSIFLLRQFIMTIPFELDEAALLDGASRLSILFRIIAPNAMPALATVAIFSFLGHWDSFLEPLIFLNSREKFTISLGLYFFRTMAEAGGLPRDHLLMAGNVIAIAPVVVLFFFTQRYFIRGIVMSGIKG